MDSTTHHPSELAADKKLCTLADAVITSSDYLKAHKVAWNKATYVVKNGVDMNLFKHRSKKQELNPKKQQIVGYVGTLDFRFDIALIAYAAEKLPHIIFEFTGHISYPKIIKALDHYENVRFKTAIAAHEVPEYLLRFDLGIVPYRLLAVNKNIYPLKINEYLAVGLPVVMTRFAELPEFSAFVAVSSTKDEFVQKIKHELQALDQVTIEKRIAFASQNSWEQRALLFGATLEAVYKEKLTLKNRTL
jgi:glycosyltransferase involved in cell wall biosynthesis